MTEGLTFSLCSSLILTERATESGRRIPIRHRRLCFWNRGPFHYSQGRHDLRQTRCSNSHRSFSSVSSHRASTKPRSIYDIPILKPPVDLRKDQEIRPSSNLRDFRPIRLRPVLPFNSIVKLFPTTHVRKTNSSPGYNNCRAHPQPRQTVSRSTQGEECVRPCPNP